MIGYGEVAGKQAKVTCAGWIRSEISEGEWRGKRTYMQDNLMLRWISAKVIGCFGGTAIKSAGKLIGKKEYNSLKWRYSSGTSLQSSPPKGEEKTFKLGTANP